jgi:hypothetical protein
MGDLFATLETHMHTPTVDLDSAGEARACHCCPYFPKHMTLLHKTFEQRQCSKVINLQVQQHEEVRCCFS